ncbi:leukocyte surface antigen CD53-like [Halichondria panicea]|uniref:leukocyte surface antigen CD53-like n=1 Tax=Halichondria panicea TaxID=6063 RepID=UPI00312BBE93
MAEGKGCSARVVQIGFVLINIFFVLLGVGLITGGSYLVATNNVLQVFGGPLNAIGLSAIIIIVGIVVFFVAAIGILGGCFQHKLLLGIYLVVLVLVIVTELGLAIGAIVKRGSLGAAVDENIAKILDNYSTDNTDRNAINFVQRIFECCGWNNASDYVVRDIPIPISCDCTDSNTIDTCEPFGTNHTIWSSGCKSGVSSAFRTYLAVIIALAIMVALIELIAVLLAIGLCCSGKKDSYETV